MSETGSATPDGSKPVFDDLEMPVVVQKEILKTVYPSASDQALKGVKLVPIVTGDDLVNWLKGTL